jgi:hypothetical protein
MEARFDTLAVAVPYSCAFFSRWMCHPMQAAVQEKKLRNDESAVVL